MNAAGGYVNNGYGEMRYQSFKPAPLSLSYNTTAGAVKKLQQNGILRETSSADRNRVYAYEAYLMILRERT